MNISYFTKNNAGRKAGISLALICGLLSSSCDSMIYDDEGDCTPHYKVRFLYDHNMKFADAFPHEVEAVTLHLIDKDGNIVWSRSEDGEPLTRQGYTMDVDAAPGRYSLIAWAGDSSQHSFEFGATGRSSQESLTARLSRRRDNDGAALSDERLSRLYHGYVADVEFPENEGELIADVSLKKNTNYIKIVLQQVGGIPMEMKDLDVTITDDNGLMEWNNELLPDEVITYRPWAVTPISADISPDDENFNEEQAAATETFTGLMAEFSTARLTENHRETARLTVRDLAAGKTIFSVKLIDFLLMVKGKYNCDMSDQEYLDRQDAFDMVFFLDEGHRWIKTSIFINSWKVVLQDIEL